MQVELSDAVSRLRAAMPRNESVGATLYGNVWTFGDSSFERNKVITRRSRASWSMPFRGSTSSRD